jgi:penicillin amidase
MKKFLKIIAVVIVLFVIGGYFVVQNIKKSGLPDYAKNIKIAGLTDKVTVYRDQNGIPHIYAQNERDLYIVTGYLEAQDRLWQMDLLRRVTQGRLSEIFGKKFIDTDVTLRKLRIPDNSAKLLPTLPPKVSKPLQYFAEGVNQYIKDNQENLPFEFKILGYKPENWKPEHSLNLIGFMAWNLEFGYKIEAKFNAIKNKVDEAHFKELLPDFDQQNDFVYEDFNPDAQKLTTDTTLVASLDKINQITPDIFTGSNNWVVAGKKSTTGKPIFSNDMHLGLNIPGIWSRMHQNVEGKLNVTGVVLPGEPFIVAGHNDHIAWGMTNVMLDGSDFYIVTINPDNKAQYLFNGTWKDMLVKKEKIFVKGVKKPIEKTLYFTHRGPIFTSFNKTDVKPVSMHWIGNEPSYEINGLYGFNHAKNWKDFRKAARGFKSVSQNIAYADTQGNIGIQMTGRLPKRVAPGYLFLPGNTDKYDWKGYVPFDSLPFEYNPARGFVSSANNRSIDPKKFKYYITEWYDFPYRIKRIRQMLTAKEKLSVEDIRLMDYDHHSVQADEVKPIVLKHLALVKNLNEQEKKVVKILKDWDDVYTENAVAPLIFEQLYRNMAKNITQDELDAINDKNQNNLTIPTSYLMNRIFAHEASIWCDDITTPNKKETFQDMIVKSFKETVKQLTSKYGSFKNMKWGNVHHLILQHPLGKVKLMDWVFDLNRTYQAPGNSYTVNPFSIKAKGDFNSAFGPSEKHIFSTANWDESKSILPTGISGNPASEFYCDQTEKYVKGEVLPDYFSRKAVEKNAKYKITFSK